MHRNEWKWKHNNSKPMGFSKSSAKAYLKKQEEEKKKKTNKNLTLHWKQLEKEEMKNPRVSRRKEIIKISTEINEKEKKEAIAKNQQS